MQSRDVFAHINVVSAELKTRILSLFEPCVMCSGSIVLGKSDKSARARTLHSADRTSLSQSLFFFIFIYIAAQRRRSLMKEGEMIDENRVPVAAAARHKGMPQYTHYSRGDDLSICKASPSPFI